MYGLQNERARQLAEEKLLEAKILASRPDRDRVSSPSARLSRRAWLLLALVAAAIVAAVVLFVL